MITIGIPTAGPPRLQDAGEGLVRLDNMLIGKEFHWQRELYVLLPGEVTVIDHEGREEFSVINRLPVETYLECVVGSEMNPMAPIEFLKAHAIISRSWAVGKMLKVHPEDDCGRADSPDRLIGWDDTSTHTGFDVCSDDHCQRYQGVQPVSDKAREAIRLTAGMVLTDERGDLIDARFSKCCGGRTELFSSCWQDHEMPGLRSFIDPWCDLSDVPDESLNTIMKDYDLSTRGGYRWETRVAKYEIGRNLHEKFGRDVGDILYVSPVERGPSGRIKLLGIQGSRGNLILGKELWIRRLLSDTHLYSSAFDIEDSGAELILSGRGWGHGVGLCQTGAAHMALCGAGYREILGFYYPETRVSRLKEI